MISEQEFVKRTLDSFDDIRNEIALLNQKYASLHEKIGTHLKVEEELEEYKEKIDKKKNKTFYIIMAIFGIAFTGYEIIEKFIL